MMGSCKPATWSARVYLAGSVNTKIKRRRLPDDGNEIKKSTHSKGCTT